MGRSNRKNMKPEGNINQTRWEEMVRKFEGSSSHTWHREFLFASAQKTARRRTPLENKLSQVQNE